MTSTITKRTEYWPQIDGLRCIAFVLVFFHHHGAPLVAQLGSAQIFVSKLAEWGWLGVDLFFILSAFLVTHLLCTERALYQSISLPKFYARRALRIWPLYLSVLVAACIVYPMFAPYKASHLYHLFLRELVAPLFCFTGNFALPGEGWSAMSNYAQHSGIKFMVLVTILAPCWSLCVEEQFYLLWGLTTRALGNVKQLIYCATTLAVIGFIARYALLSWQREKIEYSAYYMHSLWHLEPLMLGALLALGLMQKPQWAERLRQGWLPISLATIATLGLLCIGAFAPSIKSWSYALAPIMTASSICGVILLALTLRWQPLITLLSNKVLTSIGKLTFGMYVFHLFVTYHAKRYLHLSNDGLSGVLSVALCFLLTLGVAVISWHVLEKHMNNLKRRLSPLSAAGTNVSPVTEPSADTTASASESERVLVAPR